MAGGPVYDVVFDLDWTLFYIAKTPESSAAIQFGDDYYQVADHAVDVIVSLHKEGHRVSLFSGGAPDRNNFLADYLKSQIQAQGITDFEFTKVLDLADLTPRPGVPATAKFAERYMKDLTKVNGDLSHVVLVDDMQGFSVPGQEKNLYWLGKTYSFYQTFKAQAVSPYDPPNLEEWTRERNKIANFYDFFESEMLPARCERVF